MTNALTIVASHLQVLRKHCETAPMLSALDAMDSALTHSQSVIDRVSHWNQPRDEVEQVELAEIVKTVVQWVHPPTFRYTSGLFTRHLNLGQKRFAIDTAYSKL